MMDFSWLIGLVGVVCTFLGFLLTHLVYSPKHEIAKVNAAATRAHERVDKLAEEFHQFRVYIAENLIDDKALEKYIKPQLELLAQQISQIAKNLDQISAFVMKERGDGKGGAGATR